MRKAGTSNKIVVFDKFHSTRQNTVVGRTGGVVGLKGNLAPEGAIVKIAGLEELIFEGPARVFDPRPIISL